MKFVIVTTQGNYKFAKPACKNAERACQLVNQSYLTAEQLKLFELMGISVQYEPDKNKQLRTA